MNENVVFINNDGDEQVFEDVQELFGVIEGIISTEYVKYDLEDRKEVLKLIGENDVVIGTMKKPRPAEFEQDPYAKNMRTKSIEHLLATDQLLRCIMDLILTASKEGKFEVDVPIIQQDHPTDIGKLTGLRMIPEKQKYLGVVLIELGFGIYNKGEKYNEVITWEREYKFED